MVRSIHHVSINARNEQEYQRVVDFYTKILDLTVVRNWVREGLSACQLDTGGGLIEVFSDAADQPGEGAIRHFAFEVDSVDDMVKILKQAGYPITKGPKSNVIFSDPPYPIRTAFTNGPVGETIELFEIRDAV